VSNPAEGVSLLRKIYVIAAREYLAVVRTKAFIISLVLLPVMMFGSIAIQRAAQKMQDVNDKRFVFIDNTPGQIVLSELETMLKARNARTMRDSRQTESRFVLEPATAGESPDEIMRQRHAFSERVRQGTLIAFVEVGSNIVDTSPKPRDGVPDTAPNDEDAQIIRFQTNSPTWMELRGMITSAASRAVQVQRLGARDIKPDEVDQLVAPARVVERGLIRTDAQGNFVEGQAKRDQLVTLFVPLGLAMLMWMVILIGSMPMMQGIVEEKQQRIAEVLLGSVTPFVLMMGKVLGLVATSVTLIIVYLGGTYWAMDKLDLAGALPLSTVLWFIVFQILAVLMYGSLYIAIGASCTDTKEMQSLVMPVNLLLALPIIMVFSVVQNPAGPLARPLTYFPPATPIISIVRLSVTPSMPMWEVAIAIAILLVTTILLVWASGRIFRIGILMQSKGASFKQLVGWAIRG